MARTKSPVEQISKAGIRKRAQRAVSLSGASCSKCGSKTFLDRHHTDYTQPEQVAILCRKCHREEDKADGTWTPAVVLPANCRICGTQFQPVKNRRAVLCANPACLVEHGKQSAAKRWKTGTIASDKSATESVPSRQQQALSSLFGEPPSSKA